jgi:succinate-semialdehyde dehydrogenase/glutarate-semialdehyde dehydrogenase
MPGESSLETRAERLRDLAEGLGDPAFQREFVAAYIEDTGFLAADVLKREIWTPIRLLGLLARDWAGLAARSALGRVSVVVPKNSLALTLAKAIGSSYLLGNETLVRMPRQLARTTPIYAGLVGRHLEGVRFAPAGESGERFLARALAESDAVVVYGDDAWIDAYLGPAERHGTKLCFEGPGNDPLVVMPDADLDAAVDAAIRGGLNNGGQSCSAFERFFVHESVAGELGARLAERLGRLKVGPPEDEATGLGPIVSRTLFGRLRGQLDDALARGARLLAGGETIPDLWRGHPALTPAVLLGCTPEMTAVAAESFGPVFPILSFRGEEDLLLPLDATRYGLNAAVYGTCPPGLADYLESHHRNVYYNATQVDPETIATRLIDGGYRRSGFVWERQGADYRLREGPRFLAQELSRPQGANR